jgi:hypothetical protein
MRRLRRSRRVLAETIQLVHPLVQHRRYAHAAVFENSPVDEVPLIPTEITINTELGGNLTPRRPPGRDVLKRREQAADIAFGLLVAPCVSGMDENLVHPLAGGP